MGGASAGWRSIPGGASEKTAEQRREKTCARTEHYRRVFRALAREVVAMTDEKGEDNGR